MKKRALTSVILAIVLIPIIWLPTVFFSIIVGLFLTVASFEMSRMITAKDQLSWRYYVIHAATSMTFYVSFYLFLIAQVNGLFVLVILFGISATYFSVLVIDHTLKYAAMSQLFLSGLYIAIGFAAISYLQSISVLTLIYVFLVTLLTDIFAYLIGIKFGHHKIAPNISPKKSLEGLLAGMAFSALFAVSYVVIFNVTLFTEVTLNIPVLIGLTLIMSLSGQFGDLIASKLKRDYGRKDFSNIFPGHGGVMDRFDSSLFASFVLVFFVLVLRLLTQGV